jgi:hypothetical protein
MIHCLDRRSPGDLEVGQHEQGAQQMGRVPGVHPDLGQDPMALPLGSDAWSAGRCGLTAADTISTRE